MATLTLSAQPGFTEISDASFADGSPVTAAVMQALNAAAKFAAVRNEQFWGYYQHSEIVGLPVSPADGYAYSREELTYTWSVYWTGAGPGSLNGTQTPPTRGATSGAGVLLQAGYDIDRATGAVSCVASYWDGSHQTDTNDGILLVMVHAQRMR